MRLANLPTHDQVLAADLARDPGFRAEWERTALGRLVANELIRYRAKHGLSQRGLAERLGMPQSQVARLELGEHNPRTETMLRLVSRLDIELMIDIRPAGRDPKLATRRAAANSVTTAELEIAVAAA